MSEISIVTAFYDIGRGDWTPDKGLPSYLYRPAEVYLERFKTLCQLKNDIVVYTHPSTVEAVRAVCIDRLDRTSIVPFDPFSTFPIIRSRIGEIQQDPAFRKYIRPDQMVNPEYWSKDYVLITNLKSFFVKHAISNCYAVNDMVAWIDFGYCRSERNIPESKVWDYEFNPEKIHLFSYKPYDGRPLKNIMGSNDVYILGAKVVAEKTMWTKMNDLMTKSINDLIQDTFVDDDQGHWLNAYLMSPNDFELHQIPDHQLGGDPFVLFREFNDKA